MRRELPKFHTVQGWEELMLILESSMAGGRREVAVAAMGVLVTVLQANSGSERLKKAMWKRALRAVGVGVEAAASPQCMVPLQARLEIITSISLLHVSLPSIWKRSPPLMSALLGDCPTQCPLNSCLYVPHTREEDHLCSSTTPLYSFGYHSRVY